MLTRVSVEEGTKVPWGYGYAYRDFDTCNTFAFPIPLNLVVRGTRRLWHWVMGWIVAGDKPSVVDRARILGRQEGLAWAKGETPDAKLREEAQAVFSSLIEEAHKLGFQEAERKYHG